MKNLLTPLKVGLLTIVVVIGLLFALRTVEEGVLGRGDTYRVYAILDNVLGLAKRSRVVMAGIEVGFIDGIELAGAKARLNLRIFNHVVLYRDASLSKISESLLGDKLITLTPGKDVGHALQDGGQIANVYEETDMTEVFRKLDTITGDIQGVTASLRNLLSGMDNEDSVAGMMKRMNQIAENVAKLTDQVNTAFESGSDKVDRILDDVAGLTSGTRSRYQEILDNIDATSKDIRKLVANLNDIVGQGGEDWKESVGGIKDTLEKASRTLENLDHITRKVNEGEGTLGRLVNDSGLAEKAEGVLDDAATITSKIARLRTIIDLHSEFHMHKGTAKNYLALKLVPKSDKYYMLEAIDDPRGSVEAVRTCTGPEQCEDSFTIKDEFKFSLQFAKRFQWLTLRFGIIENTGGLGANLHFLNDDLEMKLDLFQFGKDEFGREAYPRLKAMAIYRPTWLANHIYLAAGGDDFFNQENDSFDYFFGAGLHFDDQDLKAIITTVGTPNL